MIPYEDLVYALAEWRARKGLPTSTTPAPAARPMGMKPAAPAYATPAAPAYSAAPQGHAAPVAHARAAPPAPQPYAAPAAPAAPYDPGYGAPTPARATAAYAPPSASYPGAQHTQAAFGGAMPAHAVAPGAPNLAAVQAAFAGGSHYEHQITDEDEVISLGEAPSPVDPLSFESPRSGTQPGIAPGFAPKPGARR